MSYLIEMMETADFRENRIDTAWLDKRIRDTPKPERNEAGLVVLIGAACQVNIFNSFQNSYDFTLRF